MKRVWIALAVFIIALACCLGESFIVNKMVDNLYKDVEDIQALVNDKEYEKAIELSKKIDSSWEKEDDKLGIFISHDVLNEVEQSLTVLKINLMCDEYNDFFSESGRVLAILQQLKDTEIPRLSNIL